MRRMIGNGAGIGAAALLATGIATMAQMTARTGPAATTQIGKLPFTISEETTVITAPLNADGTPDYIGALNAKFSQGVTPENNGFVLWSELAPTNESYGDSFPPKLREKILQLAGAKQLPPGSPTFQNWDTYIWTLTGTKSFGVSPWQPTRNVNVEREPWTEHDFPQYAQYLKTQDQQLDKAVAAAARPQWWLPVASPDDRALKTAILTPIYLGGTNPVSRDLSARAMLRLKAANFDGFLSDVLAIKRLARHMHQRPDVGVMIDRFANDAITGGVTSGLLTGEQCRVLSKTLESLPPLANVVDAIDIQDRWEGLDMVILVATAKPDPSASATRGLTSMYTTIDRAAVDWDVVLKQVNQAADEHVAAMKLPNLTEVRAKLAEINRAAQTAAGPTNAFVDNRISFHQTPQHATREDYSKWLAQNMMLLGMATGPEVEERYRQVRMEDEILQVLIAAAEAKAQTGNWPATAEQLIPARLKEMPLDVFSNDGRAAVLYKLTESGPRVYSVGKRPGDLGLGDFGLPVER
jgi:hypothetical protein